MSDLDLPLIIEPEELEPLLGSDGLLVVDVCQPHSYDDHHIPGSVHIDYTQIVSANPPAHGLIPDATQLEQLFSANGISNDTHVVAYDDEGGGKAARLLWTLEVLGHTRFSLLNGGHRAWLTEGHQMNGEPVTPTPGRFEANYNGNLVADADFISDNLDSEKLALIDARTEGEYLGLQLMASRGGHIPGAKNWDWMELKNPMDNQRLIPADEMREYLAEMGITTCNEVVVYCHTHHRSSLTYIALKSLGYRHLRGYPGSWSDWGNRTDTPIEE